MSEDTEQVDSTLEAERAALMIAIQYGDIIPAQPVPLAQLPLWVSQHKQ